MGNAINAKLIKKEGEAPKGALAVNVYGDIGGSGGSGTAGTVEISNDGATLDFDALKAIALSRNPTVTATIIGGTDEVDNIYSRVFFETDDLEVIEVVSCAVYSHAFSAIGCYHARQTRGYLWNLMFIDVNGNEHQLKMSS